MLDSAFVKESLELKIDLYKPWAKEEDRVLEGKQCATEGLIMMM